MPVQEPATLRVLGPPDGEPVSVVIVDVSHGGMGLRTPMCLTPGAKVQILMGRSVALVAEVRHTKVSRDEFYAGVRIENVEDFQKIEFSGAGEH